MLWAKANENKDSLLWSIWNEQGRAIAKDMTMQALIAYLIVEEAEPIRQKPTKSDFVESKRG